MQSSSIYTITRQTLTILTFILLASCSTTKQSSSTKPSTKQHISKLPIGYTHQPGGGASYQVVSFNDLPQWHNQSFLQSLTAFKQSCNRLIQQPEWQTVCQKANEIPAHHNQAIKSFFEQHFTAWQVSHHGKLGGTITGYYEPVLAGDFIPTQQARFPIYGIPDDFVSVPLPSNLRNSKITVRIQATGQHSGVISANGKYKANLAQFPINPRTTALKGRFVGNQFIPYYTRNQINGGALNGKAPILGYANDPVELFFLHIQGSGRIKTPDGQYIRLGYADKNEYPYVSIGRYMANKGYLPLSQTSMQNIKTWLAQNPNRLAEVLGQNPSYVFFRTLPGSAELGPIGALGVPLTGKYSGAVDRHYITLGAPLYLATTHPDTQKSLNRLIIAQDTGSAITGAVRVDYFWGYGNKAGQSAGKQKYTGYVWQLLPHGVLPRYQP